MTYRWRSLAALFIGFMLLASATPAQAAETVIYGTRIANASIPTNMNAQSTLASFDRSKCAFRSAALIRISDKTVYVGDQCADGIPAAARVGWNINGTPTSFLCVNNGGVSTTAVCRVPWPDSRTVVKTVIAGLWWADPDARQWQWGGATHFSG